MENEMENCKNFTEHEMFSAVHGIMGHGVTRPEKLSNHTRGSEGRLLEEVEDVIGGNREMAEEIINL